ncbi:MAG: hypothetical protein KatS3mg129_3245 [Leptospiraceae bacterium]|nr:MAG: hypothetical protein KatS3mg129_3245 [Leptospiraceae bacterium]
MPIEQRTKAKEKTIYIEGNLKAKDVSDDEYLKPGPYLVIKRTTEMYAYVSKSKTKEVTENGKKVKKTTYYCEKEWTNYPESSYRGEGCKNENRINPSKKISDFNKKNKPSIIKNGQMFIINGDIEYINMPTKKITNNDLIVNLPYDGNYFYIKEECKDSPEIGCERFSYFIITYDKNKTYTAIGDINEQTIIPYISKEENSYLIVGEGNFKDIMSALSSKDTAMTWILFGISVLCFGFGLILIVGPFLDLIEMIPILGNFGAGIIRFILFVFAFIVMGISFLLIEYWYIVLILGIIIIILLIKIGLNRSKKQEINA